MLLYQLRTWPLSTLTKSIYQFRKGFYKPDNNRLILIAAYPRSACNYLSYLVSESIGYERRKLSIGTGFFHETIYLPKLIDSLSINAVVTQHIRANSELRSIIQDLDLKIIILVRNIYDVIISYNDYITKWGWSPLDPDKGDFSPEFCGNYKNFDISRKYDYIISTVVPWYISFYVSWYNYGKLKNIISTFWITYEDFIADQKGTIQNILQFYGFRYNSETIDDLIKDNTRVNYNKGIVGRGAQLTESQNQRVQEYISFYPDIDFSAIGLPPVSG